MALPNRKTTRIDQALKIFGLLTPDELARIRKRVEWRSLIAELDEQNKHLPPLTDEEIAAEVNAVRAAKRTKRAS